MWCGQLAGGETDIPSPEAKSSGLVPYGITRLLQAEGLTAALGTCLCINLVQTNLLLAL